MLALSAGLIPEILKSYSEHVCNKLVYYTQKAYCCTRLPTSHPYSVHLFNARVKQYLHFFIPYTGKLLNSLLLSVFSLFPKRNVKTPLMLTRPAPLASFLILTSLQGLETNRIFFLRIFIFT